MIYEAVDEHGRGVISWASILDEKCRLQAESIARLPIVDGHVALMPDAHFGFGPPVGSAFRTRRALMPYAVGVDIGCGMIAVRTDLERDRLRGAEGRILGHIRELIPSGTGTAHPAPTEASNRFHQRYVFTRTFDLPEMAFPQRGLSLEQTARIQFGTLGAGNHFVEICTDTEGAVWFVLHSGSRGVGNRLANYHVRVAKERAAREGLALEDPNFAWLDADSEEYAAYIDDMLWAQHYAFEQREAMMEALCEAVAYEVGPDWIGEPAINCHHNYAEEVERDVWLTRKGAIDASPGVLGIIPGSMGAATYIVRGLGNPLSWNTSAHGAGRVLGRNVAKKQLDVDEFKAQMAGRTWLDRDAEKLLDEAPSAYKPIETVIADSADLVEPVTILSQFVNYKGI